MAGPAKPARSAAMWCVRSRSPIRRSSTAPRARPAENRSLTVACPACSSERAGADRRSAARASREDSVQPLEQGYIAPAVDDDLVHPDAEPCPGHDDLLVAEHDH